MELGVVHTWVELPIRKLKFDLHASGVNHPNTKQFTCGRIQLE